MGIVRREVSDRTLFGKIIKWIFILFNVLMFVWIVTGVASVADTPAVGEAERAGRAIGATIGVGLLLTLWVMGDIILGLFVLFTRRKKIVEVEE
ncbi:hypothetical protein [Allosphingosinicella sp.]|uniref:hypothetical protein n=1 Tax=Allosphingosinicella sp. TaxID=2823234 RepID=UPI002F1E8A4A